NAGPLASLGIGGYTESGGEYSLPAATLSDLAALDQIPTGVCTVSGPRCLSAVESFIQSIYPGHALNVQPDGKIRVFDLLDPTAVTLTLEDLTDLVSPPSVRRSLADCFTKVTIFGQPRTVAKLVSLSNGGLEEWFQYPGVTNSAAKAAWTTDVYKYGQGSRSTGTLTVTDTTHVVLTSADATQTWDADAFGPAGQAGILHLSKSVISGFDSIVSVRVVANTALTAGGTSTFTLESPLPATDYDGYTLYGFDTGPALVYRRYRVVDADMRAALARKFSPSAVWLGAYGGSATSTNFPMASVCWDGNEVTDGFSIDIADGTITFFVPTYITAGNRPPDDVRVLIAVNEDSLTATAPASGWEGTAYSVDGLQREQRVFMKSWTDPANQAAMDDYAQQLLDTNKNTVVDLNLTVNRILDEVLPLANQGLNIAADGYSTGLEDANLPISGLSIVWNNGAASLHTTSVTASNRRQPPSENLLPPERQRQGGYLWGPTSSNTLNPWDPEGKNSQKNDAGGGA
ncbi:hypothetical protein, partial [Paludisphaera rhizosphaerae]|uniref:hypothetical protein n=1 Tax=Paludisphaera rhizosphaerae TaxID=2711216 RepID=UPI0013ED7064